MRLVAWNSYILMIAAAAPQDVVVGLHWDWFSAYAMARIGSGVSHLSALRARKAIRRVDARRDRRHHQLLEGARSRREQSFQRV